MLQILSPTCMVSTPRLPHLHWFNCVLGATLPGHKLGIKVPGCMHWAVRRQHQGRGLLKSIAQYLGIRNILSSISDHCPQTSNQLSQIPVQYVYPSVCVLFVQVCGNRLALSPLKNFFLSSSSNLFQVLVRKPFLPYRIPFSKAGKFHTLTHHCQYQCLLPFACFLEFPHMNGNDDSAFPPSTCCSPRSSE